MQSKYKKKKAGWGNNEGLYRDVQESSRRKEEFVSDPEITAKNRKPGES